VARNTEAAFTISLDFPLLCASTTTMNLSNNLEEDHPVDLLITLILFLVHLLVEACQLLFKSNQPKNYSKVGTTATLKNGSQIPQSSQSIASGTDTEVPKKVDGTSNVVNPSKTSASSPKNKPLKNSSDSTSSTRKSRRRSTTSISIAPGLSSTPESVPDTAKYRKQLYELQSAHDE